MKRKGFLGGIFAMALILVLTLVLSVGSVSAAEPTIVDSGNCGKDGSNVTWTLDSNGLLTISGTGEMADNEDDPPWYSYGLIINEAVITDGVTSIGNSAFYGCRRLTSITIPDSVTYIGSYAFSGCTGLTNVTVPDSVIDIDAWAFSRCTSLTSVTIPDSVTSIEGSSFSGCRNLVSIHVAQGNPAYMEEDGILFSKDKKKLVFCLASRAGSYSVPDSVTSIGDYAFYSCTGLKSITVPDSVTSIEDYAFYGCTSLTSVTIGNSVTSIGYRAFCGCTDLTSVTIDNSVTSIGGNAFRDCTGLKEVIYNAKAAADLTYSTRAFENTGTAAGGLKVVFGESVEKVPAYLFYNCKGLTSVTIGSNVTSIGYRAFSGCTGLTSVTVPDSVTSIGRSAFSGCTGLKKVIYNAKAAADLIEYSRVFEGAGTAADGMKVVFGESVERIPAYLFCDCTSLKEVIYNAKTVADLTYDSRVFENAGTAAGGLKVVFGESVEKIPAYLFRDYTSLTSVTIGSNVTSIGRDAFSGCTGLTSVEIPNSVTNLSGFSGCTGLTSVTIPDSVTSIGGSAFSDCTGLTSITIPDSVTSIGADAFCGCMGLTSVTIPDSVTSIGGRAFNGCTGLTGVTIPDSVTSIGERAFSSCTGLTGVTIPDNVTDIGDYAFLNCTGLAEIYYNAKAAAGGSRAFWGSGTAATGLKAVFGESVEKIPAYLFYNCTGLTSVTIGSNVTSIGGGAFNDCNRLTEIIYKAENAVVDSGGTVGTVKVFENAGSSSSGLRVIIGDGVKKIPGKLFWYCTDLTSLIIGRGVRNIESRAFDDCTGLKEIYYNANAVEDVGALCFMNVGTLSRGVDVIFGKSVKKLPASVFPQSKSKPMNIRSITFTGDAPTTAGRNAFGDLNVCAFYPYQNETWTATARTNCSKYLNWKAYSDAPVTDVSCKIGTTAYVPDSSLDTGSISMTLTHDDGCVETIPYNSRLLELGSYDMSTTGEKVIDVTYKGNTAQLKVYVHEKKTETLDKAGYPESSHDYENNLDKTYTYKAEGAFSLDVTFSAQTEVEANIDYLYVNGTKYTGTELAGKTITISGDTLTIRLVSDKNDSAYGFSIDSIVKTYMGHEYENTVVPPTCTEQGYTLRTCPCGSAIKQNYVDALGHDMVTDAAVAPTCTKTGLTEGSHCNRCDETITEQKAVPALGHDMVTDAAVAPTCTKTGLTEGSHCNRCDETITEQKVVPALGHDMVTDAAVAPTCMKTGLTEGSHCGRCDEATTAQKVVPALGHDMVIDAAVAPTCTKTGLTEGSHCGRCDEATTAQKVVPALGHDMVIDAAVAPTCTKTGLTEGSHCGRCGEMITEQKVVPALGHDMVIDAAVAPTCTEAGLTEGSHCSRCDGATTAQKIVPAMGHDMVTDAAVAPTCTEAGLTEGSHCSRCDGATTAQKIVPAMGHDMVTDAAVAPTCTETGLTEGSHCTRCDEVTTVQTVIPALGHHFNEKHICGTCGVEDSVAEITLKKLPVKTSYAVNEETLDVTGGIVSIRYESGDVEEIDLIADMVSGFDNTALGKQTLTVTISGLTTTFEVEVIERTGSCGENLTWTLDSTGLLTISGTGEMADYEMQYDSASDEYITTAPWGNQAKMVVIGDGVTSIGDEAFRGCTGLTSIKIPESMTNIGYMAFSGCTSLADVYYGGTERQWNAITIDDGNDRLLQANRHCAGKESIVSPTVMASYLTSTGKPYIQWDAVAGADSYSVYRSGSKDGTYTLLGTTTSLNYTDSTANAGYTYYYKVKALTADGTESDFSAAVAGTCHCARPTVTPDYLTSTGKPYLKWAAVAGASQYEVYRSGSKDGTYTLLGTTTATNYTDSKANAGYTYYYKVKAVSKVKTAANSYYSTAVAGTCHCARPTVTPDYLTSTGKPYLKWAAVAGASQYEVYRSGSKDGTYTLLGTTTATNYTDSKANAGYTYYYKVKAVSKVKTAANSYYSTAVAATCHCARPSVKITTTSAGKPRLTWDAVAGASQYEIYRATSQNGTYTKMYTTTALSYTNTSAKADTTYYYKVKAVSKVKSTANSSFSTVVSIKAK